MNRRVLPWVLALGALVVFVGWYASIAPDRASPDTEEHAADFPNYYFGGQRLWDDRPVYEPLADEVQQSFAIADYDTYPADPPVTVVVMSPFSALGYSAAWYTWSAISVALFVLSMWLVARELDLAPGVAVAISIGSLVTTPARFLFARNHVETIVLLAGVLGWIALRRGSSTWAGRWFAVATAIKMFPGMWLLGVLRRDRRAGLVGLILAGGALLVAAAVVGGDNTSAFISDVIPRSRLWYGSLGNYSLVSFGTALVGRWLGWVLMALGIVVLVPIFLWRPRPADQMWVMGTAAALLISPLSWLNYLVLVLPALVLVATHRDWSRPGHRIGFVAVLGALAFWSPVVTETQLVSVAVSFVPTYGLIALFIIAWKEPAWSSTSETPSPISP